MLRVVSFNVRNGLGLDGRDLWWLRRRAAADAVARLDPDLAGLQEVYTFQQRYLLRRLGCYAAAGAGRDDGRGRGERCPVLYRTSRLRLDRAETRWLSAAPSVPGSHTWGDLPRVATLAWFTDLVTDAAFGVVDTHWGSSPLEIERSAALILEWLEPGLPWIVMGDLNATIADPPVRALLEGGLGDALGGLPAAGPGVATHHTFDGAVDGTRIDHILVTPHWTVRDARIVHERVDGRLPSDHWPVVADLELTSGRAAAGGEEAGP